MKSLTMKQMIIRISFISYWKLSHDPFISAFFLANIHGLYELQVNFIIDKESTLQDFPKDFHREKLVTILGNLLDNSFEAVLESGPRTKKVRSIYDRFGERTYF